jgi:D-alanyl-D-alanine carboxypeptidase (penicillin-binding protein 5/6)
MTTWVVLQKLPLTSNESGPCLIVNAADVAFFHQNLSIQESTAKIQVGENLCENTLLKGLLVHSAGDYAELLVRLAGMSTATFVATMNVDATTLGLSRTHFADFTGISPSDLSTARDIAALVVDLVTADPIVNGIVVLPKVHLPVAGWLVSYTPYVGSDGVVGVKSGYTLAAGGCVAMAINVNVGGIVVPTYEVVLSQQGGNALNVAGAYGLGLMRMLRASMTLVNTSSGKMVKWIGSPALVTPTTTTTTTTTTSTSTTTTTLSGF